MKIGFFSVRYFNDKKKLSIKKVKLNLSEKKGFSQDYPHSHRTLLSNMQYLYQKELEKKVIITLDQSM